MTPLKLLSALICAAIIISTPGGNAAAHITANPNESPANSWFRTALRVSHGCEGSSTTAIQVTLPDGVMSVRPQIKPGWTIEITMRTLEQPIEGPHGTVTEVADTITWRGGLLPDIYFDEFGLSMRLPNKPGETLYFPTIQDCENGSSHWTEIPAHGESWGGRKYPAPYVTLKPSPNTHNNAHGNTHDHSGH